MADFQTELLVSQLKKLSLFSARRKENVKMYDEASKDMPEIIFQKEMPKYDTIRHLYIIRLNLELLN